MQTERRVASDAFQSSDEANLMPAELPSWLEASVQNPLAAPGTAIADAYIEGAGPDQGNVPQAEPIFHD
jgi:hypothetical protein